MGSNPSKPADQKLHVFHADAPVTFSSNLVDSLQDSHDSDTTRARQKELQVQKRVQEELQKLHKSATEKMNSVADSISQEPFTPAPTPKAEGPSTEKVSWTERPLLNRLGDFVFGGSNAGKPKINPNLDHDTVYNEVDALRQRLAKRKHAIDMDKSVAKAKDEVVSCLQTHDRKPLNCWQEVEAFKAEVGRLERAFVEKNGA